MEPFIFELGNRANKVEILRKDDRIEIKAKGWLGKKNWREINEVLLRNGFEWPEENLLLITSLFFIITV